ncbi:MAG: DNA polymerase III subunit chi [Rhodospirillaceae bacterium]|nr:DNA polymerase III subunit chi [Rhodospirillaceae bacterium]|tara:strand:- start:10273 stop:10746 length:474 start_codon:yes stop_codon:yes gene_type:complete
MTDVGFYHLQRTPLERALPKLLEKALERGMRALVLTESAERADHLNDLLWTYDPASFLPHGVERNGTPERQPIWLTDSEANANQANLLVLLDSRDVADLTAYERVIDIFDGQNDLAVSSARSRWKERKDAGHPLTYWQQTDRGGWEKKAEANTETAP